MTKIKINLLRKSRFFFLVLAIAGGDLGPSLLYGQPPLAPSENPASDNALSTPDMEDPQWGKTPPLEGHATVLHGLDKMTARVFTLEAKHGYMIKFGTLRIMVRGCKKSHPEESHESAAFLEIDEQKQGEKPTRIFSGWLFSSSPALSALEHPVYDIWVTDCLVDQKK